MASALIHRTCQRHFPEAYTYANRIQYTLGPYITTQRKLYETIGKIAQYSFELLGLFFLHATIPHSLPFVAISLILSPLIFALVSFPSRQQENAIIHSHQTISATEIETCQKRNTFHKKILLPIFRIQLFVSIVFRSPFLMILNIPLLFLYESIRQQQKLVEQKIREVQENPHLGEIVLSTAKRYLGEEVADANGYSQQLTPQHFETCEESIPFIAQHNYLRMALLAAIDKEPDKKLTQLLQRIPTNRIYNTYDSRAHPWLKTEVVLKNEGKNPNALFEDLKRHWHHPSLSTKPSSSKEDDDQWKQQIRERVHWEYDPFSFKKKPPVCSEEIEKAAKNVQRAMDQVIYIFCDNEILANLTSHIKQWEKTKNNQNTHPTLIELLRTLFFEIKPKTPPRVFDTESFPSP